MKLKPAPGDGAAFTGLVLGVTLSVAGNVAHAYVPPEGAPAGWTPETGLVISSLSWPLLLFWTLEIMLSQRWPKAWYWHVIRWGALGVVAGVAAVVSYQHLSGLLQHWNETEFAWRAGPLAVDGLLIMSSTALVVRRLGDASDAPAPTETPVAKPVQAPIAKPVAAATSSASAKPRVTASAAKAPKLTGNAKTIYEALPGSVATITTTTGIKRTTVDYTLKKALNGLVRQDSTRTWRRIDEAVNT